MEDKKGDLPMVFLRIPLEFLWFPLWSFRFFLSLTVLSFFKALFRGSYLFR